jgi:hypothetical protein
LFWAEPSLFDCDSKENNDSISTQNGLLRKEGAGLDFFLGVQGEEPQNR